MKRGLGTYLAQGAVADALVIYVLVVAFAVYFSDPYGLLPVLVPFYLGFTAVFGAVVGGGIWVVERVGKFKPSMLVRIVVTTSIGLVLTLILVLCFEDAIDSSLVMAFGIGAIVVFAPASIVVGTRFQPARILFPRSDEHNLSPDVCSWVAALAGFILRLASVFGFLEALVCTVCLLRRSGLISSDNLLVSAIATIYFAVSGLITYDSYQTRWLVTVGTVLNGPLLLWAWHVYPASTASDGKSVLIVFAFTLALIWGAFIVTRWIFPFEPPPKQHEWRLVPVTMLEVRIRHALNYW